jgi:hypothetical protein
MDRHPVKSSKLGLWGGGLSHSGTQTQRTKCTGRKKGQKSMEIYWIIEALTLRDDRYLSGDVIGWWCG